MTFLGNPDGVREVKTLSEKRMWNGGNYKEKDVKQHIKELEEDFRLEKDDNQNINFNRVIKIIKERAGEDLI